MNRSWAMVPLPLLLGMGAPEFRFHRSIEAPAGWCELEIPDDVLEASRPGLPDVRIRSHGGEDLPFIDRARVPVSTTKLPLVDVEVMPKKETTAVVDRGDRPGWVDAIELEITEVEFIKPVTVETSTDRGAWSEIARTSIFATPTDRMTKVRFAPNDRRYLRFRFDDRNGAPMHPVSVALAQSPEHRAPRVTDLEFKAEGDAEPSVSTYAVALRSANFPVVDLRIAASDAAFARKVRVFERVLSRDEVSRHLLGEGEIARSADGRESTRVTIAEPTSRHLEVDIERSGGVPLHVVSMAIATEPRVLLFHVPKDAELELFYASNVAERPRYDLDAALATGRPANVGTAIIGPTVDTGATTPLIADAPRGVPLDLTAWKSKRAIALPARGPVAYVDIERGGGTVSDVRIVDQERRQVPYVVESSPRHTEVTLGWRVEPGDRRTDLALTGIDPAKPIEAIAIDVASPSYFERDVSVVEVVSDPRGPRETRVLGTGRFARGADAPPTTFRIPIARPAGADVRIRIDDGDNSPLAVASVRADVVRRRLDFLFARDDHLTLLSDNPLAGPPRYDLALVAERVLSSPAEPASLGEVTRAPEATPKAPPWFWLIVSMAAAVLFLAVGRALREPRTPSA